MDMLIDGETRQMDEPCDRPEFSIEVKIIKSITLSEKVLPNLMICSNSKDGRYTITRKTPLRCIPKKERAAKIREFEHRASFILFYHKEIKLVAFTNLCHTTNAKTSYQPTITIQHLS